MDRDRLDEPDDQRHRYGARGGDADRIRPVGPRQPVPFGMAPLAPGSLGTVRGRQPTRSSGPEDRPHAGAAGPQEPTLAACGTAGAGVARSTAMPPTPSACPGADRPGCLARLHAVIIRCNRTLARAVGERALLNALCRDLVEVGGYGFVWIGYGGRTAAEPLRLMAYAGAAGRGAPALAAAIQRVADEARARAGGRGEQARAAALPAPDPPRPDDLAPWSAAAAAAALRRGLGCLLVLPLAVDDAAFGDLGLLSATPDAFDDPARALLAELAADLAVGIQAVRARRAEAQAARRLRDDAERVVGRRLAATLHDGIGQTLQGLSLGLKRARELAARGQPVPADLLDGLVAETAEALQSVRAVSCELRPAFLDRLSLIEAIRVHAGEMARRSGIDIRVRADQMPCALANRVKEQCFLAFREALSNALRHAAARHIRVLVRVRRQDRLTVAVLDDGVGFDTRRRPPDDPAESPPGLGLGMIRERAEGVQGSACIRSRPGRGTAVSICVPLHRVPIPCR